MRCRIAAVMVADAKQEEWRFEIELLHDKRMEQFAMSL